MLSMWRVCCVCIIEDQGSLVGKHCEVCIHHEVDDLISGRHLETVAEPINTHLSREHGVKHEILEVLQGFGRGEEFVCHVSIIHTGRDRVRPLVCHLADWLGRLTELVLISRRNLNQSRSHSSSHLPRLNYHHLGRYPPAPGQQFPGTCQRLSLLDLACVLRVYLEKKDLFIVTDPRNVFVQSWQQSHAYPL